jgi:hypothetical protein
VGGAESRRGDAPMKRSTLTLIAFAALSLAAVLIAVAVVAL